MSDKIKNVVLIGASPKAEKESALSEYLLSLAESRLKSEWLHINRINVRRCVNGNQTEEAFAAMLEADAMMIVFPLYFFCLPGLLMRFLQDYYQYCTRHGNGAKTASVFAVVNCGFPEAEINEEAVRVIQSFSRKIGAEFRFGVLIGGGGMILGTKDAPFMRKTMAQISGAFDRMKDDILESGRTSPENMYVTVNFHRKLYFFMGNAGWSSSARKYGLKKKDLYRKAYRDGL